MKNNLLLLIALSNVLLAFSQDAEIKWSEPTVCNTNTFGYFDSFIGGNSKYVYGKYLKYPKEIQKKTDDVRIVAYDKTTMKQVAEFTPTGFKSELKKKEEYKDKMYVDCMVTEEGVMVIWSRYNKNSKVTDHYAEAYDREFNRTLQMQKICETKEDDYKPSMEYNKLAGNYVLVHYTRRDIMKGIILFCYAQINQDLTIEKSGVFEIPYKMEEGADVIDIEDSYWLDDNGLILGAINVDKRNRAMMTTVFKSESFRVELDIELDKMSVLNFQNEDDSKKILSKTTTMFEGTTYTIGLYANIDQEKSNAKLRADGVFIVKKSRSKEDYGKMNFTAFNERMREKLYAGDTNQKTPGGASSTQSNNEENVSIRYQIEQSIFLQNELVLVFSEVKTYSYLGSQGSFPKSFSDKGEIVCIRMSLDGEIMWVSSLDRGITYMGYSARDVNAVKRDNKLFMTYGNAKATPKSDKKSELKKLQEEKANQLEYAYIDLATGKLEKGICLKNAQDVAKSDKKSFEATAIYKINNEMYVSSVGKNRKDWSKAYLLLLPVAGWIIFFETPFGEMAKGHVARIVPSK